MGLSKQKWAILIGVGAGITIIGLRMEGFNSNTVFHPAPLLPIVSSKPLVSEPRLSITQARVLIQRDLETQNAQANPGSEPTLPSRRTLREEVERDPHSTPASLVRFSLELSEGLKSAVRSDSSAEKFFVLLANCVNSGDPEMARATRAICLSQARILADRRAVVQERYASLYFEAEEEVKELLP